MKDYYGATKNLLKKLNFNKFVDKIKKHKKLCIIIASVVGVLTLGIILFNANVGGIKNMVTSLELEVVADKLYYEYPKDMSVNRDDEVILINNSEDYLFGIVYSATEGYEEKLEDIVKLYGKIFTKSAASRTIGNIYDSDIKLTSTEKTQIKGYDSVKFIGVVKNKGTVAGWDCYVCGYTYVIDGQPIMVIGLISSKTQSVKLMEDVSDITERIASSVRTKK